MGLSPDQMWGMLYNPFDSPDLITFPSFPSGVEDAPIVKLFQLLADAIGDQGLKPTATGNLPRKFLREAGQAYMGEEGYQEYIRFGDIRSELDFFDMQVTRYVAEFAGLVRRYKGKFILSRECRKIMGGQGLSGIYPLLFRTLADKLNWGYHDCSPDINLIQQSFLFSLYLLDVFGDDWRSNEFYEDAFLRAFPMVMMEVPSLSYSTPDETLRRCYCRRFLKGFAQFLGLVEIEPKSKDILEREFNIRKLPLLSEAVVFHLQRD